jgi:hypothetical protein
MRNEREHTGYREGWQEMRCERASCRRRDAQHVVTCCGRVRSREARLRVVVSKSGGTTHQSDKPS